MGEGRKEEEKDADRREDALLEGKNLVAECLAELPQPFDELCEPVGRGHLREEQADELEDRSQKQS